MGSVTVYPAVAGDDVGWNNATPTPAFHASTYPELSVGYDHDGTAGHIYLRFPSVNIPHSSTISTAVLTVYGKASNTGANDKVKIYAEDADTSVAPTSAATGEALVLTTASVAWNVEADWSSTNQPHAAPDITTVIQEVVSRTGWSYGNAIGLVLRENGGSNSPHYIWGVDDGNASYYAKLVITFIPGYDVLFKPITMQIR